MKDLNKTAAKYFEAYPKEDTFLVTSDGQFFTEANKSQANTHQRTLKNGKIKEIHREDVEKNDGIGSLELPEGNPTNNWKADQLKAYVEQNEVPLEEGDTSKKKMLAKIEAFLAAKAEQGSGEGTDAESGE